MITDYRLRLDLADFQVTDDRTDYKLNVSIKKAVKGKRVKFN